jgi:hypothetical protein
MASPQIRTINQPQKFLKIFLRIGKKNSYNNVGEVKNI